MEVIATLWACGSALDKLWLCFGIIDGPMLDLVQYKGRKKCCLFIFCGKDMRLLCHHGVTAWKGKECVSSAHLRCTHKGYGCIFWHTTSANSLHHVCKMADAALQGANLHVSAPGVSLLTFKDMKRHIIPSYVHSK